MNDCYFDKKDWRICSKEVGICPSSSLQSKLYNRSAYGETVLTEYC